MLALAVVSWVGYARMVRGQFLSLKQTEFVEAAKGAGAGDLRIMFVHLLPNALGPVIVQMSLGIAGAILSASGLSFLGLGAQPPTAEWGAMLNAGKDYLRSSPHLATYPGLAIMITVLAFNFVGDGLRDALDPRLKE
jgi:peptide/nickel transport system permease protein